MSDNSAPRMGDWENERRFSHSELKDFQRCKRRWYLRHVCRLAPKLVGPVGPLQSGTRVHAALESYYTPGNDADPREVLEGVLKDAHKDYIDRCDEIDQQPDQFVLEQFKKDAELERAMIEGYFQWLEESGADAHLTVIAAEEQVLVTSEQLGAEFMKPFVVVAKLDARVFDETTGFMQLMDHKTVQNFAQMLPTLQSDTQMLHYHLMLSILYPDKQVDGALYNMLRKVKRGKTAKPPFFMRETIVHNAAEVESYRLRMLGLIANIFELEARIETLSDGDLGVKMFAQPNPTRDCSWDCSYVDVCPLFDDGSRVEDAVSELFEVRDPMARYTNPGV